MKSKMHGKNISTIKVSNISHHGFWILVKDKEHFLPFDKFPWFKEAKIKEILDIRLLQDHHLYWPKLDVDLTIDMIKNPDKYPLVYQ